MYVYTYIFLYIKGKYFGQITSVIDKKLYIKYVYIYVCIYTYTYMYIHIHICIYIYIYVYIYIHTNGTNRQI